MPIESVVVIVGVVLVFGIFAVSLAWADYYTRNIRTQGSSYFH